MRPKTDKRILRFSSFFFIESNTSDPLEGELNLYLNREEFMKNRILYTTFIIYILGGKKLINI